MTAEQQRLREDRERSDNWKRWGPYLSERQWGTVREDYSADGTCWDYFPHEHARSRAYRWGEDGLLGWCDRQCRLCFAPAIWNGKDAILKERLFGLTGNEGNHGEDVKECYYYLDATPTSSYCKGLYRYPCRAFPYDELVATNRDRDKGQPEFELLDSDAFADGFIDLQVEYAKAAPDDCLVRLQLTSHAQTEQELHLLPTVWFRNTWSWGCEHEGCWLKPRLQGRPSATDTTSYLVEAEHASLGSFEICFSADGQSTRPLFTENESNQQRLFGADNAQPYVKDAFHRAVIDGDVSAVNPDCVGTKMAMHHILALQPGQSVVVYVRIRKKQAEPMPPVANWEQVFAQRMAEADAFYDTVMRPEMSLEQRRICRQANAGLLWSKQFYHYIVKDWLEGDPDQPKPADARLEGRNSDWPHLFNRDIISMPDKWEYPWYAAWDLAFHMIPMAELDAEFAKDQLLLFLREWYMHPNGQIPAYEFALSDVNPPVHAWACWRVYKKTAKRGQRDRLFLARVFQKLLINFTWWVNRKDPQGRHIFSGGFLGLDNIGVFDRSKPLPHGGYLEQADATAWMAFYCGTMLSMALELAAQDPSYEGVASKFFEHFVAIIDAINAIGDDGLWDELDGFYYDQIQSDQGALPLRIRSLVGLVPLLAVEVLEADTIRKLPGFYKRMRWFLDHRRDLAEHVIYKADPDNPEGGRWLLAVVGGDRLRRCLRYVLDEQEFLSPYGIRSLSYYHHAHPFAFECDGDRHTVGYVPGESDTYLFGGNSNWRGPIWFPLNYLIIETLERYHYFYGDEFRVECPVGSAEYKDLRSVVVELHRRLQALFVPDESGRRPAHGRDQIYADDPAWRDLILFYEYFHADDGRGCGASHQTGWTSLIVNSIGNVARQSGE